MTAAPDRESQKRPLKVLYLQHVGPFGGSSRSLLEMIVSFPANTVAPHIVIQRGRSAAIFRSENLPVTTALGFSQFDNTKYSYYRGMRWLVLLRELAFAPFTVLALLRAKRLWSEPDIVHINEVTLIPPLLLCRLFFRCPIVIHARSVQRTGESLRTRSVTRLLRRFASAIVAIDSNVRRSLPAALPVVIIHNGLRFPGQGSEVASGGQRAAVANRPFTVAMVGIVSRVKGCIEFVRAAAICKQRNLNIQFVLIGGSARTPRGLRQRLLKWAGLAQHVEEELKGLIETHGLQDMVEYRPFTTNLDDVYRSIDVLCFPSHFDAPGRPIFEAAFYGLPSIAAVSEPLEDTIIDGKTGLTIRPRNAGELAAAIERLYRNPSWRIEMGQNARKLAIAGFDAKHTAAAMLELYRSLPARGTGSSRGSA